MRYNMDDIIKNKDGIKYYRQKIFPTVLAKDGDIFIISRRGDRLDSLAQYFYSNSEDYWIISIANNIPLGTIFIPPGKQIRIPMDISSIKREYNTRT